MTDEELYQVRKLEIELSIKLSDLKKEYEIRSEQIKADIRQLRLLMRGEMTDNELWIKNHEEKRIAFEDYKNGKNVKCSTCGNLFYAKQSQLTWRKLCGACYYKSKGLYDHEFNRNNI